MRLQISPSHHHGRKIQHVSGEGSDKKYRLENSPKHATLSEKFNFPSQTFFRWGEVPSLVHLLPHLSPTKPSVSAHAFPRIPARSTDAIAAECMPICRSLLLLFSGRLRFTLTSCVTDKEKSVTTWNSLSTIQRNKSNEI